MKARIRVELPPGVGDTPDVRAKLVKAIHAKLGCGPDCDCDLEKSEAAPRKLRHRGPQAGVEQTVKLYETMMDRMVADIAAVLAE